MTRTATLAGLFDDLADSYDHEHHEKIAGALLAQARPGAADAVADVACGAGAVALRLAADRPESAPAVLAIDVSPGMIDAGRTRAAAQLPGRTDAIDWQVGDAVPLPVPDGSLDTVLCASSLHFLGTRALTDWRRALRPGGRIGFTLPLATHFRPSDRFAALLAADIPLPNSTAEATSWATANGFTDVLSCIEILGTRRVVMTTATSPAHH
ncbi:class I SAM-dependent methyltransferase [Streptomyces sp. J2-1]|uniref:class I SAM-dependent methyltransferase n=1 Tax=Streptomyces corallincola TaxID=2851888 RepID=UPI001C38ED70|nr:class I SAM-dependent methyltransferase [Streptomyces corallincola]MBV2354154.1 class I SAM-dependent methyltransferase [Streptomyces corallincola]